MFWVKKVSKNIIPWQNAKQKEQKQINNSMIEFIQQLRSDIENIYNELNRCIQDKNLISFDTHNYDNGNELVSIRVGEVNITFLNEANKGYSGLGKKEVDFNYCSQGFKGIDLPIKTLLLEREGNRYRWVSYNNDFKNKKFNFN